MNLPQTTKHNNSKPFMFGFGAVQEEHRLQISTTISKGNSKHKFDISDSRKNSGKRYKEQKVLEIKENETRQFQLKAALGPTIINKALPFRMSHYNFNDRSIDADGSLKAKRVVSNSLQNTSSLSDEESNDPGTNNVYIRLNQPSEGSLAKLFTHKMNRISNHGISASVNLKSKNSLKHGQRLSNQNCQSKSKQQTTLPDLSLDTSINILNRVNQIAQNKDNGMNIINNNGIQMQSTKNFYKRENSPVGNLYSAT